jgi:hypothetical protein
MLGRCRVKMPSHGVPSTSKRDIGGCALAAIVTFLSL